MSDFFSFLKSNRPKIGLVDSYDLGEIYASDQKDALKNIFLDPDALDQIYTLSRNGIIKEDIRVMGGLDLPVIHSLKIANETLTGVSYDISRHIRTNDDIGEPGKHSFSTKEYSNNIIVFHGGIAANSIEYNFLDENGEVRTTTVPTSRESLFNSVKDADGKVTLASYPSLFRIRRRSHLNELRFSSNLLIPRQTITESPTDVLNLPVYMRTETNPSPSVTLLQCYATRNSPIVIPVRISTTATFTIGRNPTGVATKTPFIFGYELKRTRDGELIRSEIINSAESSSVSRTINVVGTLGQNQDCKLYIYLDPETVESLNLSGFGIKEDAGKDLGFVGFNNLKSLNISNNSLSTYPVWLKTLHDKLEYLNISENSYWNNGIVEVFDYQDLRGSGIPGASTANPPVITATQVLGYSGFRSNGTKLPSYTGEFETIADINSRLYKDARINTYNSDPAIDTSEAEGFRTFSVLKELIVGSTNTFINADFSKIFPNLENFQAPTGGNQPRKMLGLLPKFKNNNQSIVVNYTNQHDLGGTINMMGGTPVWTDTIQTNFDADPLDAEAAEFIGRFKINEFSASYTNIRGGFLTGPDDVGNVAGRFHVQSQSNVVDAWKGWLDNLQSADIGYYSNACFKVATGSNLQWKKMRYLGLNYAWSGDISTKVEYNSGVTTSETADDILFGNSWSDIQAWQSGWGGKLFSISNAPNIVTLQLGSNDWFGYGDRADGFKYLLPDNFVNSSDIFKLANLYLHFIINGQNKRLILRQDDFKYFQFANTLYFHNSKIFGKFPTIYNDGILASRIIDQVHIGDCNFRDISSIGSSSTKRIRNIYFYSQGANVGGALMPNFSASSNNTLERVNGSSSLSSYYPSNWKNNTVLAEKPIISLLETGDEENTVPGITWYRDSDAEGEGERIYANNEDNIILSSYLMVGDQIIYSDVVRGIVTQIDLNNKYIYAKGSDLSAIPDSGTNELTFRRNGQNISSYFEQHTALLTLDLNNCRCVGSIPLFQGCKNLITINLKNNLFTTYQKGTLGSNSLFGISGSVKLGNFYLQNNPLTKESIRKIIKDCYDFVITAGNRGYNINIFLGLTNYDPSTKQYKNWTRAEIFDAGTTITVPDPTDSNPGQTKTQTILDPYESYFNRMGPGNTYPNMKINLF